jgi:hypothetical protein
MGMGTTGNTPNPSEQKPGNADAPRNVPAEPKNEMAPQDETDRSVDLDAVRRELAMRDPSLVAQFEKRNEKPAKPAAAEQDEPKAE